MAGPGTTSDYHRELQERKRSAIVAAATRLFLHHGYDGASLVRIADDAGVSTATLFKRFPTKAALFDAIVTEHWALGPRPFEAPAPADPRRGLTTLGRHYVEVLTKPEMVALFRIVIAEAPRFPDLSERHFALGKMPFFETVQTYVAAEVAAGHLHAQDPELVTTHFLGMIATFCFWPRLLLPDYAPSRAAMRREVEEAVATVLARYG